MLNTLLLAFFMAVPAALTQDVATPDTAEEDALSELYFQTVGGTDRWLFDLSMEPGDQASLSVVMGNAGAVEFEGTTYAADSYSMVNGGFAIHDRNAEQTGISTWLNYPTETFTVSPGEGIEREFTVVVPEDAAPGEYVAGLAWETMDDELVSQTDSPTGFQLQTFHRIIIGVRIVVPGDMAPAIELGDPSYIAGPPLNKISVPITNTGNQRVELGGSIRVTNDSGEAILESPIQLGRIYGGHETTIEVVLENPIAEGEYRVDVELSDESGVVQGSLESSSMNVFSETDAIASEDATVQVSAAEILAMPSADDIQYVDVNVTILNAGPPATQVQPVLVSSVDGIETERFPLGQPLSLEAGDTDLSSRYVPAGGWKSGEWEFTVELEIMDPSGELILVVSQPIDTVISIP